MLFQVLFFFVINVEIADFLREEFALYSKIRADTYLCCDLFISVSGRGFGRS